MLKNYESNETRLAIVFGFKLAAGNVGHEHGVKASQQRHLRADVDLLVVQYTSRTRVTMNDTMSSRAWNSLLYPLLSSIRLRPVRKQKEAGTSREIQVSSVSIV